MAALDALELKIPPPLVTLTCALAMWAMSGVFAPLGMPALPRHAVALVLLIVGFSTGIPAVSAFKRVQTTIDPRKPDKASALVTTGMYRYSRNPMYLGLLIILTGWAIHLDHPLPWLMLPVFVLYLNRFQIGPEERVLKAAFGDEYVAYTARVRRWI